MRILLAVIALFIFVSGSAQGTYYTTPLRNKLLLSGSFGELRNDHFHSGIDIKTQGITGLPVQAVADGYVSRISISPGGFGNAIYINHDNNTTSVYGHLGELRPDIQQYVQEQQYEKKSFKIDITLPAEKFEIKKNQVIAKSGNTGSSGGPHLHFEIRNTKAEDPLNPLRICFPIADHIAPIINALQITPLSASSHINYTDKKLIFDVDTVDGKYKLKNKSEISVYGPIGFAIEAIDLFDNSTNKCGISSMTLKVDDVIYSEFNINRFSFNQTKAINSYIDYEEYMISNRRFQRTWLVSCNGLSNFEYVENNGILDVNFNRNYKVNIEIKDAAGNSSILEFELQGKYREMTPSTEKFDSEFECSRSNHFEAGDFSIDLPKDALYENLKFRYSMNEGDAGYYSAVHNIHENSVPLNKNATVSIPVIHLDEQLHSKVLLVQIDPVSGKYKSAGGNYNNGNVVAEISSFGKYALRIDTIAPKIVPLSIVANKSLKDTTQLKFVITDELSGIQTIEGLIDEKWALFEYDAKNNVITHYFDAERFEMNKQHSFKLTVTDNRGNGSVYEASFHK